MLVQLVWTHLYCDYYFQHINLAKVCRQLVASGPNAALVDMSSLAIRAILFSRFKMLRSAKKILNCGNGINSLATFSAVRWIATLFTFIIDQQINWNKQVNRKSGFGYRDLTHVGSNNLLNLVMNRSNSYICDIYWL